MKFYVYRQSPGGLYRVMTLDAASEADAMRIAKQKGVLAPIVEAV